MVEFSSANPVRPPTPVFPVKLPSVMLMFFNVAPLIFENKPISTRAWSAYDNSMNFEKLPVVSTGKMLLDLSGNGREPVAIRPIFRLRGINVTGLNKMFILPDRFGKG